MKKQTDFDNIDAVISFLQSQKELMKRQESEIEIDKQKIFNEISQLEAVLNEQCQKNAELKLKYEMMSLERRKEMLVELPRRSAAGKHKRTQSDLSLVPWNKTGSKESLVERGHSRKKSHQDNLLKFEQQVPSFIRQNIKHLIASRINTDSGKKMRLSELNIRRLHSRGSSRHTLGSFGLRRTPSIVQAQRADRHAITGVCSLNSSHSSDCWDQQLGTKKKQVELREDRVFVAFDEPVTDVKLLLRDNADTLLLATSQVIVL